jgi:threonylcarbamoyladenosine tRNA methylthiotransferase MtaB
MKTVALHTLGCKLNFAETASLGRQFREQGYTLVDASQPSDVFVLNTCSVTERADRECRQLIRRVRRQSPDAYVIVTGCYAQLRPEEIASIDGVDLVLGANEKFDLFAYANGDTKKRGVQTFVSPANEIDTISAASSTDSSERTRAFVKVQDGCDYSCSFCTIPIARGASRSIPIGEILAQVTGIADQGYKEIVLTGVNVGDYGKNKNANLLLLLKRLVTVNGIHRIRVSSIEPNLLTDDLIEYWLSEKKLCKHFHIPLQHGTDALLGLMRRRYRTDLYRRKVEWIKRLYPDACIGADVLVGFPGETDAIFEQGYSFLRDLPLSYLHTFTYSERPGTDAIAFTGSVEPRIRADRSERLRMLGIRKRRLFYESFLDKTVEVLFEQEREPGVWVGCSGEYVRVIVRSDRSLSNELLPAIIREASNDSCSADMFRSGVAESEATFEPETLSKVQIS